MRKKDVKRIIASLLIVCIITFSNSMSVHAANPLTTLGETVAFVSSAVVEGYEESVISQMIGRAGSRSPYGAKGIAFEIIYKDTRNLENFFCIFKPSEKIVLSTSSTDALADLVVTNSDGSIVELIQCKDGNSYSQARNILRQVLEGKYEGAQLVGTKECAAEFNRQAEALGIEARMIDSGISTEYTKRVADKALGGTGALSKLLTSVGKSAMAGGVFCGAVAAIESAICNDSIPDAVGHVTVASVNGAISTGGASAVGGLLTMGFAAVGASGMVSTIGVFAAALLTGGAIMTALDSISNTMNLEAQIAHTYDELMMGLGNACVDAEDSITQTGANMSRGWMTASDNTIYVMDDSMHILADIIVFGL